jgi:hypothetical protein
MRKISVKICYEGKREKEGRRKSESQQVRKSVREHDSVGGSSHVPNPISNIPHPNLISHIP